MRSFAYKIQQRNPNDLVTVSLQKKEKTRNKVPLPPQGIASSHHLTHFIRNTLSAFFFTLSSQSQHSFWLLWPKQTYGTDETPQHHKRSRTIHGNIITSWILRVCPESEIMYIWCRTRKNGGGLATVKGGDGYRDHIVGFWEAKAEGWRLLA